MKEQIAYEIQSSIKVKHAVLNAPEIISKIEDIVNDCLNALSSGGKIIFCGNGGSFADSQHLAAEFVSRLRFD
jgi:D-sedoheptulose 7-phosphate isomerase